MQLPFGPDTAGVWPTVGGNPSNSAYATALCGCLVQSTDPTQSSSRTGNPWTGSGSSALSDEGEAQPATPANCPICILPAPNPPNTLTSCAALSGTQSTWVILVGDPGISNTSNGTNHNVGDLFNLAAQTQANSLQAQGNNVVSCRVSTIQDVYAALTLNGTITGGVYYFGHSGLRQLTQAGIITAQTSEIFVGQLRGIYTNITASNVDLLQSIQTQNNGGNFLGTNAAVWINGCQAGETVWDTSVSLYLSIAQLISVNLGRGVYAYDVPMHFSTAATDNPNNTNLQDTLPMYMVPDGVIGQKPAPLACTPSGGYCTKTN